MTYTGKALAIAILATITAVLVPIRAHAQATEGTVLGTVRDPTGAVVPGVAVTVTNADTGISRSATTDGNGNYAVPQLLIGQYNVRAARQGFKAEEVSRVRLVIAGTARVDITLQIGTTAQQVTVAGSAVAIQTDSAELAYSIGAKPLVDLPLNGRQYLSLAQLIPGANAGLPDSRQAQNGIELVVAGARSEANYFIIDGISNMEVRQNGFAISPPVDAIQEFRVETSQYSAEYGMAGGAVVNVSTKAGTNDIHGALYEFLRNDVLDANNYFDLTRLPYKRNQFGAAAGGPIKKNRTFYFGDYEGTRIRQSTTIFDNVPTPAEIKGDFSAANFIIYDPTTAHPNPANPSQTIRNPFPGNIIPASRINPIGEKIASAYAAPNYSAPGGAFNFANTESQPTNQDQYDGRIDYTPSDSDQVFGRASYSNLQLDNAGEGAFPGIDGSNFTYKALQVDLSETHTFSGDFLNEFRIGYTYLDNGMLQADILKGDGSALKIPGLTPISLMAGFPSISVTNLAGVSRPGAFGNTVPNLEKDQIFEGLDTVTRRVHRHWLKFGLDVQRVHSTLEGGLAGGAAYSFSGQYTSAVGGAFAFNGAADLLLGLPANEALNHTFSASYYRYWNQNYFIQDDWQLSPNITVSLGLRYELQTPATEIGGRESNLDPVTSAVRIEKRALPWLENVIGVQLAQLPFPTEVINSNHLYNADTNNIAPRIGLAYRPFGSDRTSIRMGFGTFYVGVENNVSTNNGLNAPFDVAAQSFLGNLTTPNLNLSSGFSNSYLAALSLPSFQNLGPNDFKTGYYNKWTLSVEHQLGPRAMFESAYTGSEAHGLYVNARINRPLPGPGVVQQRRQFPLLNASSGFFPIANSSYNGWLNHLQINNARGVTLDAAYTYSKAMDDQSAFGGAGDGKAGLIPYLFVPGYGLQAEWARASFDAKHRFTLALTYATPRFDSFNPVARSIVDNWMIQGIVTLQTGFPFQADLGQDVANVGDTAAMRPNQICNANLPSGQRTTRKWFQTSCFTIPAQYTFGDARRNTIQEDGIRNLDFSTVKNIPLDKIHEGQQLQFRAEFFNLFNNVDFAMPGSTIATSAFGIVTATNAPSREIQFALKYLF